MVIRNLFSGRFASVPDECPECLLELASGEAAPGPHSCDPLSYGHSIDCDMDEDCRCGPVPQGSP